MKKNKDIELKEEGIELEDFRSKDKIAAAEAAEIEAGIAVFVNKVVA